MTEPLTSKVVVDDSIAYHKPGTNEWKILRYLLENNGEWVSISDVCNATGSKGILSVSRYISMLIDEHNIERKRSCRTVWYRHVGKMKVSSEWYDILNIVECKNGLWVSSARVSEMTGLDKVYVGNVLSMFVKTLGLEKKLEARLSYYRYLP